MGLTDLVNSISNISNPYGAPSAGMWNLQRCIFQQLSGKKIGTVLFYEVSGAKADKGQVPENYQSKTGMEQIDDKGGRRLAVYNYPYRDGQAVGDLGSRAQEFTMNIKFWGLQYQARMNDFLTNVASYSGKAQIIHPIRGIFPIQLKDWDFLHVHSEWNSVTIKVVFIEDNSVELQALNKGGGQQTAPVSIDQSIRNALSKLSTYQSAVNSALSDATAILKLPGAIQAALSLRLASLTSGIAQFQAQLAATFSSHSTLNTVNAQAAQVGGTIISINSGTIPSTSTSNNNGGTTSSQLPPVLQSGFDPSTASLISSQLSSFLTSNTITVQQAMFTANQLLGNIAAAIAEAEANLGIYVFATELAYRQMAVMIQDLTQACVSAVTPQVIQYTVPKPMSLRMVAWQNNLDPDRQNDIESLNPYLESVNRVEAGTVVLVPAS